MSVQAMPLARAEKRPDLYDRLVAPSRFFKKTVSLKGQTEDQQTVLLRVLAERCCQAQCSTDQIVGFIQGLDGVALSENARLTLQREVKVRMTEIKSYELGQKAIFGSSEISQFFLVFYRVVDAFIEAYAWAFGVKDFGLRPENRWHASDYISTLTGLLFTFITTLYGWIQGVGMEHPLLAGSLTGLTLAMIALAYGLYRKYLQPVPNYASFCENITELMRTKAPPALDIRKEELDDLIEALRLRAELKTPTVKQPWLVGPSRSGKGDLIKALAHRILTGDVPSCLKGLQVFRTTGAKIATSSGVWRGQGGNLTSIFESFRENPRHDNRAIYFIDEIQALDPSLVQTSPVEVATAGEVGLDSGRTGGEGAPLFEVLKTEMEEVPFLISATTPDMYARIMQGHGALRNRATPIRLQDIDAATDYPARISDFLNYILVQNGCDELYFTPQDLLAVAEHARRATGETAIGEPQRSKDCLTQLIDSLRAGPKGSVATMRRLEMIRHNLEFEYKKDDSSEETKQDVQEKLTRVSEELEALKKQTEDQKILHKEWLKLSGAVQKLHRHYILSLKDNPKKAYLLKTYFIPRYEAELRAFEREHLDLIRSLFGPIPYRAYTV